MGSDRPSRRTGAACWSGGADGQAVCGSGLTNGGPDQRHRHCWYINTFLHRLLTHAGPRASAAFSRSDRNTLLLLLLLLPLQLHAKWLIRSWRYAAYMARLEREEEREERESSLQEKLAVGGEGKPVAVGKH